MTDAERQAIKDIVREMAAAAATMEVHCMMLRRLIVALNRLTES